MNPLTAAEQFAAQETAVLQKGTVVRQLRLKEQLAPAELQPVLVKAAPAMYRMPHSHATSQQIKAWQQQLLAYGSTLPDEASHAKQAEPLQHLVAQAEMQSELIGAFPGANYRPVGLALRGQQTPQVKPVAAAQNYSTAQTPQVKLVAAAQNYSDAQSPQVKIVAAAQNYSNAPNPALLQKTSLSKQLGPAPRPAVPSWFSSLKPTHDFAYDPHRRQQMPEPRSTGATQQQYDAPHSAGLQQGSTSKQLDSAVWPTVNDLQPADPGSAPLPTDTIAALGSVPLQLVRGGQASDFWGGGLSPCHNHEQHRAADDRHLSNFLKTRELTAYASQLL